MRDPRPVPRSGDVIARADLTTPIEIVERMARDLLAARRRDDPRRAVFVLVDVGWTWSQVSRFGLDANDLALTPAFVAQDVVRRIAEAEEAAETAVALALATPSTGDMTAMVDDLAREGDAA